MAQAHGPNVIKLFCPQFTDFHNKLDCFVPGKPFQPSLMFVGKAGAYRVKHLSISTLEGRLLALPTNIRLDSLEKLVRNKHSSILQKFVNYGQKVL